MNNVGFLKIHAGSDSFRTFFEKHAIPDSLWSIFSRHYEDLFVNDLPSAFAGNYLSLSSALCACLQAANGFECDTDEDAPSGTKELLPHESMCAALGTTPESLSALFRWLSTMGTQIEQDPSIEARIDILSMAPDGGGEGWYYCLKASGGKQTVAVMDLWNDLFAELDDEMGEWLLSDLEQSDENDLEALARDHGKFRDLSCEKPEEKPRAEERGGVRRENSLLEKRKQLQVGEIFPFGSFPQADFRKSEAIRWAVLDIKDGKALLLTERILANTSFHKAKVTTPWCDSRIREWLNHDFIDTAFSSEEREIILSTEINEPDPAGARHKTEDAVFLLSADEAKKYMPKPENRAAKGTKCAQTDYWGLRSIKKGAESFQYYTATGRLGSNSFDEMSYFKNYDCTLGVRPAVWIAID